MSSRDPDELHLTLYRHGLSLAVLFDLLVEKGIVTTDEIRRHAQTLNHRILIEDDESDIPPG